MITRSPEETRALGVWLAGRLHAGDVVILTGDLGAGKSELARGIARGLGIRGPVPSPTFTILNVYTEGNVPLYHFDFYRLNSPDEIYEMGMDEYIGGDGIALIEWPDLCREVIPRDHLRVSLERKEDDTRQIRMEAAGGFRNVGTWREGEQA